MTAADAPGTPAPSIMSPAQENPRGCRRAGFLLVGLTGFEPATT